jgi:ABC-type lipoprotein release transport system permease subunit
MLIVIGVGASIAPARRALSVQPAVALRQD